MPDEKVLPRHVLWERLLILAQDAADHSTEAAKFALRVCELEADLERAKAALQEETEDAQMWRKAAEEARTVALNWKTRYERLLSEASKGEK